MSRRRKNSKRATGAVAVLVVALAAGGSSTGAAAEPAGDPVRVCLVDRDLPRSDRVSGSGFDLELATVLAQRLGRALEIVWTPSGSPFSEIEDSELPLDELADGECDVAMSVPGPAALGELGDALALTRPYYGAAFELIAGPGTTLGSAAAPVTVDALAGEVIAVRLQTVSHFAVHRWGLRWLAAPTTEEVLETLASGAASAALVWGPEAATQGLATVAEWRPPRELRWNLHLATRRADAELLRALEDALAALSTDSTLPDLAARWGLVRPPFDEVFDPAAWAAASAARR